MTYNDKKNNHKTKLTEKGSAFLNQKQLRIDSDQDNESQHLAGDQSTDNRIDITDTEENADQRLKKPTSGVFMHPMHDATDHPEPNKPRR